MRFTSWSFAALTMMGCAHDVAGISATTTDRLEIRELIDRYNDAINHRNWHALRALFADDAVWEVAPPIGLRIEGGDAIAKGIEQSVGRQEFLVQSSSAIVIDSLSQDRASARSTLVEFGRPTQGAPGMRAAGTYYDQLTRVSGAWRFKHRILRVRYMDEVANPGQVFDNNPPAP